MSRLPKELWYIIASCSYPMELKIVNILCHHVYDAIQDIIKQYYNPLLPLLYMYPDAPWHKPALVTNLCLPITYILAQDYCTYKIYDRCDAITLASAPPSTFYRYASHEYLQDHYPDATQYHIYMNSNLSMVQYYKYKQTDCICDNNVYAARHWYILLCDTDINKSISVNDIIAQPHLYDPEDIAAHQCITLDDIYTIDNLRIYDKNLINYVFMCPNLTYNDLIKLINDPNIINDFYMLSYNNFNR